MGDSFNDVSESLKYIASSSPGAISGITGVGAAAKGASMGMKLLTTAGNLALSVLLSFGLAAFDKYVLHYQDRLNEAVEDAREEYEESESTLQSLQSELDTTKSKIEELYRVSNSGGLNIVEQEDLKNLEREAELLERQIELEERKRDLALHDTRKASVESLNNSLAPKSYNTVKTTSNADDDEYVIQYGDFAVKKYLSSDEILQFSSSEPHTYSLAGNPVENYDYNAEAQIKVLGAALKKAIAAREQAYNDRINSEYDAGSEGYKTLEEAYATAEQDVYTIQRNLQEKIDNIRNIIGDDEKISNPNAEWERQFNWWIDLAELGEDYIASMSNNKYESVFKLLQNRYADEFSEIQETVGNGVELTVEEFKRLWPEVANSFDAREIGLEDVVEYFNDTFAKVSTPTTPTIPDASALASSLYKNTEAYTTLNDAISEQASAGKISAATMQELLKINPDFINSLEETADGYKISTDALMDYIEAQDLLERTKAVDAIAALNKELSSPITDEHRNEILSQIQQLEMLVYEYDNATGALARYRAAQATENQDSMFQEGTAMYKMMKEALEIGKTGTDDFQAAMEFMLGEDWAQRFESVEAAQEQALKNAEQYFGQETESDNYINFFDKLVDIGMASKENGQFLFDQKVSLEEIAEAAGMSLDAVRALFGLAEAYGAEFDYDFEVDTDSLEYSKALLDELAERKKNLEAALGQTTEGSQEYQTLQNEIALYDRMIAAGQAADGATSGTIDSLGEMVEHLAMMKQYQSDLSGKGFDIPVQVSGDINAINGLLSNFETIEQEDGSITYSIAIDENATDEEIEGIKTSLQNSLESINSSTATQAVKDCAAQVVNAAISAIDDNKSFEQTISSKIAEALSGGVGGTTGAASSLVVEFGATVDKEQVNEVDKILDAVAEKERTVNFTLSSPEEPLSSEELGNMSYEDLQAYYRSRPRSQRVDGQHELELIPKPASSSGSQFVDEVQNQIDESAKDIKIDSEADQYGLVQAIEDMLASESQSTTGFADGTSGYQDMSIAVDVPKQKLNVDVDAQLSSDVGGQIAEEAQEQINQEQVVAEIGIDVNALDESAQEMISIAESAGVAQEKQENLKTATESLKAAFANLQAADPYDAEGLQAASSEFNSAVQNFQSAYNTLASDLQGIDPINVRANISSAQRSINSLNGKVVTITVKSTPVTATVNGQTVGATNARGTTNARNGMSLVDEEGAELIEHVSEGTYELGTNKGPRFTNLNAGDIVHTASETRKILSRMGSSIGGFFRNGLNNAKAIVGGAFANTRKQPKAIDVPIQPVAKDTPKTNVSGSASANPGKKPSSSSSSSSSHKGSGSSSSSKKDTKNLQDYLDKLFDWIEVRLTRLQEQTDGWIASAAEAVGYLAKNAQLDNAMNSVSKQIEANTKGYARYMQQANEIAEKFNIPDEVVKLVQEGDIDIASYDEDQQEKIKAYQEWYDKAVACKTAVTELKEQERELAKEQLDNIINHYQWRIDRYDNASSMSDANLEFKRATGQRVNINDYGDAVMANINKQAMLKAERSKLSEELEEMVEKGLIKKGSEEWFEYMSTLDDLDQTLVETKTALVEIQDAAQSIDLTELQWTLAAIERSAASIQNLMSLHEAQGIDHVAADYVKLIKNGMAQIANLEEQNKELLKMQEGLDVNSEKYQELQEQINANIDSIAGMKVNQEQWNDAILDLDIKKVQDYRDALTKQNTAYQNQLNLQQSLENLEKARSQRTQRVYREGMNNAPLYSNIY